MKKQGDMIIPNGSKKPYTIFKIGKDLTDKLIFWINKNAYIREGDVKRP